MTYLLEEDTNGVAALVPGGMSELETYDALARERAARAAAEATASHLAELIAAEHRAVAAQQQEIAELREALGRAHDRADAAERELGKALVNDYSQVPPAPLWERVRHSLRG